MDMEQRATWSCNSGSQSFPELWAVTLPLNVGPGLEDVPQGLVKVRRWDGGG